MQRASFGQNLGRDSLGQVVETLQHIFERLVHSFIPQSCSDSFRN